MFVIAGVTGHVGGVAANELLAAKQKLRVIVRDADKGRAWSAKGAEVAVGALDDTKFLAGALKGAIGFFTLLPADFTASDLFAAQKQTADSIASAVKSSGVPTVVLLSSIGADLAEGTGPIKGLHYLEEALRKTGTKLVAVRAGYFMENVGQALGAAKSAGIYPNFAPSQDQAMPMIATKDIGKLVAQSLTSPPAKSEIVDLIGPSYSVKQAAEKLGTALGKQLQIVDIPAAGHVDAMMKAGFAKPIATSFAEMYAGFASGKITPKGDRLAHGTTPLDDVIATLAK